METGTTRPNLCPPPAEAAGALPGPRATCWALQKARQNVPLPSCCREVQAAHECCVAGAPHPSARRIYESGRPNWVWEQFQHSDGACTPGILSDRQPLCDSSGGLEEILACRGPRSGRRLPRNRLLRLHGVLELLRGGMGSGPLPPKNGFCG
ncbi:hypothetical protein CDAR_467071 [Caerostris darwini]|uniref:Uncharacterized protein n=1 Tax=Caerostris darwini TaxID=1538125 RepID=A0AAV4TCQ3_9ARAC|nr:hypothetical protein CDAR_467071 [Caerostris darwini]